MATFGPTLRRTREERGISLDEIANETRLSKRYILALEDEAIGKLPGGTYNRAYLRTYATYLGLEPESLLREYAAEEARHQQATEADQLSAMNRAIEKRGALGPAEGRSSGRDGAFRTAALATAAAIVIAAAGGLVWFSRSGFPHAAETIEADLGEPAAAPVSQSPATTSSAPAELVRQPAAEVSAPAASAPAADAVPPASSPAQPTAADSGTAAAATVVADGAAAPAEPSAGSEASSMPAPAPVAPAPETTAPRVVAVTNESVPADAASHLSVADSGVGTAVIDRQLVGQSDRFAVGSKVVFWTHVRGGRAGDTIDHVWFRDGIIVGAASLNVGSPDWRTQSRRLLDPSGVWVVEARDAEGHVLARHQFRADEKSAQ